MRVALMGIITIVGFPLLGFLIHFIFEDSWYSFKTIFYSHSNLLYEFLIGSAVGIVGGLLAWSIIQTKWMLPIVQKYGNLVKNMRLSTFTIILLSLCAGVGEEIFFRGVMQDYLGIWITAIIFVAVHGYINPKDWRISLYGYFMILLIAGLGYMTEYLGLTSAIMAHTLIDVVLFYKLTKA